MPKLSRWIVSAAIGTLVCAWTDAASAGDDRIGVATHFHHGSDPVAIMPLIQNSGVGWIRDDVYWGEIERTKGQYSLDERTRQWVPIAKANGLKIIMILNGNNRVYDNPYDVEAYAAWCAWMAQELKGQVDCFEILNEPANFGFTKFYGGAWNGWENGKDVSPWVGHYVTLLNRSAEAIKKVSPDVKVIGLGSVSPVNFRQIAIGVSGAVDGMVDHPYSFRAVPEIIPYPGTSEIMTRDGILVADERGSLSSLVQKYHQQSAQFKGPREIWFTEWGFPTYRPVTPQQYAGYTPNAQAKYTQRRLLESLGLGVKVSVIYDIRDDGSNPHDPEHNFGLLREDLSPKPSYQALQRVVEIMKPWQSQQWGTINVFPLADRPDQWPIVWDKAKLASTGSIQTYQFTDADGRRAVALWSTERADGDLSPRSADVELMSDRAVSQIMQTDMMNGKSASIAFDQSGQRLMIKALPVPDYPILLVLSSGEKIAAQDAAELIQPIAGKTWKFWNGQEFPGAKGSHQIVRKDQKDAVQLNYDFTGGGQYIVVSTDIQVEDGTKEMRVDVSGKQNATLLLRLVDVTGQTHQYSLPYIAGATTQTLRVDLQKKAYTFGGAADGAKHYPLRTLWIGVEKQGPGDAGMVTFSNIRWIQ